MLFAYICFIKYLFLMQFKKINQVVFSFFKENLIDLLRAPPPILRYHERACPPRYREPRMDERGVAKFCARRKR